MSDGDFGIAVIGGGPAGTSAAITAARFGAKVAIFEARNFPRHKVCGEFISAEALGVLAVLLDGSENESRLADVAPAISRTRIFLGRRTIEAKNPFTVSIARYDLTLPCGGRKRESTRESIPRFHLCSGTDHFKLRRHQDLVLRRLW